MNKISRNEPCPCGSGKKYKKCCFAQEEEFFQDENLSGAPPNPAREFLNLVKDSVRHTEVSSIDELNERIEEVSVRQNSLPRLPFLGLSSEQMHITLYAPFSLESGYFRVRFTDKEKLNQIPLVKQSLYFLEKLQKFGPMKATQKGNLPLAFVKELYEVFFLEERFRYSPNSEEDLPEVVRLRRVLTYAGLIKFRTGKFSLTKKGESLIVKDKIEEIFENVLLAFVTKWNWGYSDRYPDFPLIQQSVIFNLYLLKKKSQDWVQGKELGHFYLNAFPMLLEEARGGFFDPEQEVISAFCIRFLERFCVPLGLLEKKGEEKVLSRNDHFFKVSDFFNKSIEFDL
jgi:hypothetical protein